MQTKTQNKSEVETLKTTEMDSTEYALCKITIDEFRNFAKDFQNFYEGKMYDCTTHQENGIELSFELDKDKNKTIEIQFSKDLRQIEYFAYQFEDGAIYLDFIKTIDDLKKWLKF